MSSEVMLHLREVCKSWDHPVLSSVDLTIDSPGIYTILGVNGVGKTTLLKVIFGILKPDSGEVSTPGRVSLVPDFPGIYEYLTAREYLIFAGSFVGLRGSAATLRVQELLEFMELAGLDDKLVSQFSNGMKQKLSLAAALLADPALLLLDEPLTGIDLPIGERIRGLLKELSRDRIILMTTHILELAHAISDQVLLLDNGRFTQTYSPAMISLEELRTDISHRFN